MLIRAAASIEGLRLEAPITLEPFVVRPVSPDRRFIGRDGRDIFNAELVDAGFVTSVDQSTWGAQLWPRRKLALAVCSPVEGDARATAAIHAVTGRMTDVLALSHGGDPRVYIGAFELSDDDGETWRTVGVMLGRAHTREAPWTGLPTDADSRRWTRQPCGARRRPTRG